MKILKTAHQKNFKVNTEYYTEEQIQVMLKMNTIDQPFINSDLITDESKKYTCVYASECKEVKVIYDKEFGCYDTVVITKADELIHVVI